MTFQSRPEKSHWKPSMMKTTPQNQPMHDVLSTYTPEPRPFTSPSRLWYSAHKGCQISRTGLGRSSLRYTPPFTEYHPIIQSDWNEQSSTKKDSDASTSLPNGRDRRYVSFVHTSASFAHQALAPQLQTGCRRCWYIPSIGMSAMCNEPFAENTTGRNFRTTLAQPSQMGNFRHQSTRTTERDREKGSGEDRETKDGQERLRSVRIPLPSFVFLSDPRPCQLSDKFDRDRLGALDTKS